MSRSFLLKLLLPVLLACQLTGCSKGLDKPLVTDKGDVAYKASRDAAAKDMDERSMQAFNWAVSDLTLEVLNGRYPNQPMRTIIRGEVKAVQETASARIPELEAAQKTWNAGAEQISKVVTEDVSFALESDFHGLQPRIRATVRNGSPHSYSVLRWRAALYLDDAAEPAAVTDLFDTYKSDGGLPAGEARQRQFTVGFVTGDAAWTTLQVQQAKKLVVRLMVLPESATDYAEKLLIGKSPEHALQRVREALKTAQSYADI